MTDESVASMAVDWSKNWRDLCNTRDELKFADKRIKQLEAQLAERDELISELEAGWLDRPHWDE